MIFSLQRLFPAIYNSHLENFSSKPIFCNSVIINCKVSKTVSVSPPMVPSLRYQTLNFYKPNIQHLIYILNNWMNSKTG